MWQLEMEATKASSGSTLAAFDHGAGTPDGDGEAGTMAPPSNVQVCSREYLPFAKSGPVRFQRMVALCSDIFLCGDEMRGRITMTRHAADRRSFRNRNLSPNPHFIPRSRSAFSLFLGRINKTNTTEITATLAKALKITFSNTLASHITPRN